MLSASDVALLSGRNNDNTGFGGGEGAWFIVLFLIFAMMGWGRNGNGLFGGGNGSQGGAMDGYVLASDFAQVDRKLDSISNGICDSTFALNNTMTNGFASVQQTLCQGFNGVNQAINTNGYENRLATQGLSAQLSNCCCDIREGISGVNYNLSQIGYGITNAINMSTRDLIDNQNANYRALHDEIVANRIEDKNAQIQALQQKNYALELASSQANQTTYITDTIIDRLSPCPRPAYLTCNPNTTIPVQYVGASCGCNNNCGCGNY